MYTSMDEWTKHMEEEHDHETFYWECSLCDDFVYFPSAQAFSSHLADNHAQAVTDSSSFIEICSRPKLMGGLRCPLCSISDNEEDVSGQQLLSHVAEHVNSFSLSSLPLLIRDEK